MGAASPGDHVAGMLAVAVASSRTLEVLDLEGTGLTNQSAQVRSLHICGRARGGGAGEPVCLWTYQGGGGAVWGLGGCPNGSSSSASDPAGHGRKLPHGFAEPGVG